MSNKHHARILLGAIASLGLSATPVFAATYTIAPSGSPLDWNTASSWDLNLNSPGSAAGDTAIVSGDFNGAGKTVDISATPANNIAILTIGDINATPGATTISASGGSKLGFGAATINSLGGLTAVNTIAAPISLGGTLTLPATNTSGLTLSGGVQQTGASTILNQMTGGASLTVGSGASSTIQLYDAVAGIGTGRNLAFTNSSSTATGGIAQATTVNAVWEGPGSISFGADSNSRNAGMTYTLMQSQTSSSSVSIGRQKYVLAADNAFGVGVLTANNSNQTNWGGVIESTADTRVVGNSSIPVGNNFAVAGAHSIEFTGNFGVTNNRNVGNNLAEGKTWTLSGAVYPNIKAADATSRTLTLDGTGTTVISGTLNNNIDFNGDAASRGNITTRGTGRLVLNNPANTIAGTITTSGGLIVFGAQGSYGATTGGALGAGSTIVANFFGGVSYAPGTGDPGFATFASKLSGTGYLALPAADANANLNFSAGGELATAPGLSVTGDGDLTYTGTVTPGASGYNWGGPVGTLTIGSNAGTGANAVSYGNGGNVVMTGNADYTGVTSINGGTYASAKVFITNGQNTNGTQNFDAPTTLSVSSIANGGVASSLGASTPDAANLVLNKGTLRHTGAAASSSDRLFTIGTGGATIESTGTGTLTLGSAGGANITAAGTTPGTARTLTLGGTNTGLNTLGSDLANGIGASDTLAVTKTGTGTWVLGGTNSYTGATAINAGTLLVNGSITGAGAVSVAAGATLGGSGLVTGATTVTGTLSPGNSAGELSFGGNLTLAGASTSQFEINGTALGLSYDSITAVGAITYGGTLNLVFGAAVTPGTYDLVNAASQSGDFSSVSFTGTFADSMIGSAVITPGTGWTWASALNTYTFDNVSGDLTVSAVPEPASVALLAGMAVLGGCLTRRRRVQA